MNKQHLTDLDLENYIYETGQNKLHQEHLQACPECKANLDVVQNLKYQLSLQSKPEFSFDLVSLVMPQLEVVSPEKNWINIIVKALVSLSIFSMVCLLVYFREYFSGLTYGLTSNWISLVLIPVIFYMAWSCKDMIISYRSSLDQLKTT